MPFHPQVPAIVFEKCLRCEVVCTEPILLNEIKQRQQRKELGRELPLRSIRDNPLGCGWLRGAQIHSVPSCGWELNVFFFFSATPVWLSRVQEAGKRPLIRGTDKPGGSPACLLTSRCSTPRPLVVSAVLWLASLWGKVDFAAFVSVLAAFLERQLPKLSSCHPRCWLHPQFMLQAHGLLFQLFL